jgi:hypothetical protein
MFAQNVIKVLGLEKIFIINFLLLKMPELNAMCTIPEQCNGFNLKICMWHP